MSRRCPLYLQWRTLLWGLQNSFAGLRATTLANLHRSFEGMAQPLRPFPQFQLNVCNAGTNADCCVLASGCVKRRVGARMPGSETVAAYRLHAAMCTEIAERTSDLKNRLVLLKMAAAWLKLAEQAEKNSEVYEKSEADGSKTLK